MIIPLCDIEEAERYTRRFYVCQKENKRWVRCSPQNMNSEAAVANCRAEALGAVVFMNSAYGGVFYWFNNKPDIFNSSVLSLSIENSDEP